MRSDLREFGKLERFFIGQINGHFSSFDMQVIEFGTERLVSGNVYVEVGTQEGRSIYTASTLLDPGVEMFAVDIFDPAGRAPFWKETGLDKRVTYINKPSHLAAEDWEKPIDMMFIDGDHSYEGVKLDVDSWSKFVKPGGWMFFHDAEHSLGGVERLMNELSNTEEFGYATFYREVTGHNTSMASLRKRNANT